MNNNEASKTNRVFVKARDKYSDMKSSAVCLTAIGFIGFIIILLDFFDILPFKINANHSYIFYITMGGLFIIFFISGIFTSRSAKKVKESISDEESQTDSIITWAIENLNTDMIDSLCSDAYNESNDSDAATDLENDFTHLPEEAKYLLRVEVICKMIMDKFEINDDSYINSMIDEIYPELFD